EGRRSDAASCNATPITQSLPVSRIVLSRFSLVMSRVPVHSCSITCWSQIRQRFVRLRASFGWTQRLEDVSSATRSHHPPHSAGVRRSACKCSSGGQHFSVRGIYALGSVPCILGADAFV